MIARLEIHKVMHNKSKKNTDPQQTMGSAFIQKINNNRTTALERTTA